MATKTKDTNRTESLIHLDVSEKALANQPKITRVLEKSGVLKHLWEYLECSEDPAALKMVALREELSEAQQAAVPVEALAIAAGVTTRKALEIITVAVFDHSSQASELLAAANQPDVIETSVITALSTNGTKDREMLLKHSGFIPLPKTQIVSVRGNNAQVVGGNQTNIAVLPPVEDTVRTLSNRFNERLIPAATDVVDAEVLSGESDDDEDGGDEE